MKVAVIGGGSTYTPELVEGFGLRRDVLPVDELVLHDIDQERLDIVGGLAGRILEKLEFPGRLTLTTDREQAVEGASFVLVQLRVGGLQARLGDETIPAQVRADRPGDDRAGRLREGAADGAGGARDRRGHGPAGRRRRVAARLHEPGGAGHAGAV